MKWSYAISDLLMQSSYYCFILQCNSWWLLLNHLCLSVHSLVVWYCWLWIKHTQIYYFLLVYMNCACKMYYMYIYVWTYTIPFSSIFFFCNLECLCMSPLAQRLGTFFSNELSSYYELLSFSRNMAFKPQSSKD